MKAELPRCLGSHRRRSLGVRLAFDAGFTHYDQPPPEELGDIERLRAANQFRFANGLRAWIEVNGSGQITGAGYSGGGLMGSTMVKLGPLLHRFLAIKLPDVQRDPQPGDDWVRFVQTTGGRAGVPAPRRLRRRPYVQWQAPLVWTTLSLTLHADGGAEFALTGASRFPRHWVYDGNGQLSHKSGLTDFGDWYRKSFGRHSPWGDADSPALVTAVETALERSLSVQLMHGRPGQASSGSRQVRCLPGRESRAPASTWSLTGCSGWIATGNGWPNTALARSWASARALRAAREPQR